MINTNLLDVNFQNKFAFSTEQYFEGKMFDQNYSNFDNSFQNQNQVDDQINTKEQEDINKIPENKQEETKLGNFAEENKQGNIEENHKDSNKTENNNTVDNFKIPEGVGKHKDEERRRRSKFDQ